MTDEKPPRRWFPRPVDDELVRVDEDPPTPTQRVPMIPPPPRMPAEPFRLLTGKPTLVEVSNQLQGLSAQFGGVVSRQEKMALQTDHLQSVVNQRFDIFHRELALVRHDVSELLSLVTTNHGPRIEQVEKAALSGRDKAALAGKALAIGVPGGIGMFTLVALIARAVGRHYPEYNEIIETLLRSLNL